MKHSNQRNIKIVDELINFCYKNKCFNMKIDINTIDNLTIISLSADIPDVKQEYLEHISNSLNTPRYHEMEEYYWSLTGDDDENMELNLVGMMVDEAEIKYNNPSLQIILKRKP
jgi:hypothetical protein